MSFGVTSLSTSSAGMQGAMIGVGGQMLWSLLDSNVKRSGAAFIKGKWAHWFESWASGQNGGFAERREVWVASGGYCEIMASIMILQDFIKTDGMTVPSKK